MDSFSCRWKVETPLNTFSNPFFLYDDIDASSGHTKILLDEEELKVLRK